jgi:hypothetical protein
MSDFNYKEYLKNNPLLKKDLTNESLITESTTPEEIQEKMSDPVMRKGEKGDDSIEKETEKMRFKEGEELDEMGDATVAAAASGLENIIDSLKKLSKASGPAAKKAYAALQALGAGAGAAMRNEEKADLQKEDASTDAEQEGYEDGFDDAKDDVKDALSKMKVSELKSKIKEDILSLLQEEEEEVEYETPLEEKEEVDVDVEVEDEIDIEEPSLDSSVAQGGLTDEEKQIQDALKLAYDNAVAMGDDKLADQIGNSITFFTRTHVVER